MPELWERPPEKLSQHANESVERLDLSHLNRQHRFRVKEAFAKANVRTLGDVVQSWTSFPPSVQRMIHEAAGQLTPAPKAPAAPKAPPASKPAPSAVRAPEPKVSPAGANAIQTIQQVAPELLDQSPSVALRRLAPEFAHVARQLTLGSALEHVDPLRSNATLVAERVVAARARAQAVQAGPAPHPFLSTLWEAASAEVPTGLLAGPLAMDIGFDAHRLVFSLEADDRRWLTVGIEAGTITSEGDTDLATRTGLLVGLLQALSADAPNALLEAVEAASQVSRTSRELAELLRRCEPLIPRGEDLLTWQADFDPPSLQPTVRREQGWVPVPLDQLNLLTLSNRERKVVRLLQLGGMPALVEAFAEMAGFPRMIDAQGESLALVKAPLMFRILSDAKRGITLRAVSMGRMIAREKLREALTLRATTEHLLLGFGPVQVLEVNPAALAALQWWLDNSPKSHPLGTEAEFEAALSRLQPWVPVEGLSEASASDGSDDATAEAAPVVLDPLVPGPINFELWRQHYVADCDQRLREEDISVSTYKIYVRTMDRLLEILRTEFPAVKTKAEVASALDGWIERMRNGEVGLKSDPNNVPQVRRRAVALLPDDPAQGA